ncbi:MAG: hypothetical protein IBX71_11375 [Candidatus Desulforudis sp.]|nr:hypothetical protein [Desulforudis sp.]
MSVRQRFHERLRAAASTTELTPHPKPVEFAYRTGFALQTLGYLMLLISQGPLWCATGYTLLNAGVLLSGWLLQVYMSEIRTFVLVAAITGCLLQLTGIFGVLIVGAIWDIKYLIPIGLGFVLAGALGIAGKEAFCYRLREGWYLMPVLPLMIAAFLVQYATGFAPASQVLIAAAFGLQLSFTVRKFKMPFAAACRTNNSSAGA